jgi:small subunit ribosomal protein S20
MATHKSAVKRHKQSLKRNERNRTTKSTLKTSVKKTLELLSKGDVAAADAQAKATNRLFDKAAVHGILHKKTAARSVSRLYQRISQAKQVSA